MSQQLHHVNNTIDTLLNEHNYDSESLVSAYQKDYEAFDDLRYLIRQLQQVVTLTAPAFDIEPSLA